MENVSFSLRNNGKVIESHNNVGYLFAMINIQSHLQSDSENYAIIEHGNNVNLYTKPINFNT